MNPLRTTARRRRRRRRYSSSSSSSASSSASSSPSCSAHSTSHTSSSSRSPSTNRKRRGKNNNAENGFKTRNISRGRKKGLARGRSPVKRGPRIRWSNSKLTYLVDCHNHATITRDSSTHPKPQYGDLVLAKWIEGYPDTAPSKSVLLNQLCKMKRTNKDLVQNKIPKKEDDMLKNMFRQGIMHGNKNIIQAMCANCGRLLYGDKINYHKFVVEKSKTGFDSAPFTHRNGSINSDLPTEHSADKFYACRHCKDKNFQSDLYPLSPPGVSNEIPLQLVDLTTQEKSQISLCSIYSTTVKKSNINQRTFIHKMGELNAVSKSLQEIGGMYGFVTGVDFDGQSDKKIIEAIRWLHRHNPLYKDLFSNYETVYGHFDATSSAHDTGNVSDSHGNPVNTLLHKEKTALIIPAEDERNVPLIHPDMDTAAVSHPKLNAPSKTNSLSYSDPDLEAKIWPHLFPYGTGSYRFRSDLDYAEYVKFRLLYPDSRFRDDINYSFFMYDRGIKAKIYYNAHCRTVQHHQLINPLTSDQVYNAYEKFGNQVPAQIIGGRNYWRARTLDILGMSAKLGTPTYFVTLTQNDNWPEIQNLKGCKTFIDLNTVPDYNIPRSEEAVLHPTETVIAFFNRLQLFRDSVITNDGPLGTVKDYWYRVEFQKRGAIHVHMVLWCDNPFDGAVTATMPRPGPDDSIELKVEKALVKRYQIHGCRPERCFKKSSGTTRQCKYGFPFDLLDADCLNDSGIRYLYRRVEDEDRLVVPYNSAILLLWQGHVNVQKVTDNGYQLYMAKYVSKPESHIDIQLPANASDPERFLRTRVCGRLEVDSVQLGYKLCKSNRDILYLPTEFQPSKQLKRKAHLPQNPNSTDIYYQTLYDKYLDRPDSFEEMTYPEYFSKVRICQTNENPRNSIQDKHGREVVLRVDKEAIPRWRFLLPYGDNAEQYFEQKLILAVPFTSENVHLRLSESNSSKTYMEECALRNLIDNEQMAKDTINDAVARGFSLDTVKEMAMHMSFLVDINTLGDYIQQVDRLKTQDEVVLMQQDDSDESCLVGDLFKDTGKSRNLEETVDSFTASQRRAYDIITNDFKDHKQSLYVICGEAGTGKSYLLQGLVQSAVETCSLNVKIASTTGSSAYLIKGCTLHSLLKMDIDGNVYLQRGTLPFLIMENANVIIVDEFSLMDENVFIKLDEVCRDTSPEEFNEKPFGNKSVLMLGDPLQIAAIKQDIFSSSLWKSFRPMVLKEVKRQDDLLYLEMLRKVRMGVVDDEVKTVLSTRMVPQLPQTVQELGDGVIIVSLRETRDQINHKLLDSMQGELHSFSCNQTDMNGGKLSASESMKISLLHKRGYPQNLKIKVDCRVVLLKNINTDEGWCNGTLAKVKGVCGDFIFIKSVTTGKELCISRCRQDITLPDGSTRAIRYAHPLDLGFALTSHKIQGATVAKAYVQLDEHFFASGQAYVALSRTKHLEDLHLTAFSESSITLDLRSKEVWNRILRCDLLKDQPDSCGISIGRDILNSSSSVKKTPKRKKPSDCIPEDAKKQCVNDISADTSSAEPRSDFNSIDPHEDDFKVYIMKASQLLVRLRSITQRQQVQTLIITASTWLEKAARILQCWPPKTLNTCNRILFRSNALHPEISKHYVPVKTTGDGNCLYNMISNCIQGDESLAPLLRVLVLWEIIRYQPYYEEIIAQTHNTMTYARLLSDTKNDRAWGCEFHLQALCFILDRNIHIYNQCTDRMGQYYHNGDTLLQLDEKFQTRQFGTGMHVLYEVPYNNQIQLKTPMRGLFHQAHYSSMIPIALNLPKLRPWSYTIRQPDIDTYSVCRAAMF